MGLTRLALAYARRRPLATALVVLLLAAGTAVVALTLLVARELEGRLTRDAAGIDLVVGAKGSPLQLVLAGVFHVDVPPGNIPLASVAELRANPMIAQAIPLALGDSFRGFRIVGTEPALVEHYGGRLAAGALWTAADGSGAGQRGRACCETRRRGLVRGFARARRGRRRARRRALSRDRRARADGHRAGPHGAHLGRERLGRARRASRRGGDGGRARARGRPRRARARTPPGGMPAR